jgi:hypothetical protein
MLTTATTEVVRLASRVVRRIDAELAESAARNAQRGVLAAQTRRFEEMRTLRELHALPGLPEPRTSRDTLDAAGAGVPAPRERELVGVAGN